MLRRVALAGGLATLAIGIAHSQVLPTGSSAPGVQVAASSGNVAAATALRSPAGKVTWIAQFQMTTGGSTAVSSVTRTVSPVGSSGATLSYTFSTSATVDAPSNPLTVTFNPPLPANAPNTAIVATCPALGAGNAHASMSAQGFQR
jgi:hypothetical protein